MGKGGGRKQIYPSNSPSLVKPFTLRKVDKELSPSHFEGVSDKDSQKYKGNNSNYNKPNHRRRDPFPRFPS